jgi:hypothetical protein
MRLFLSKNTRLIRVLVMSHIVCPLFHITNALVFIIIYYTFLALSSAAFCVIRLCNIPSTVFVGFGLIYGVCMFMSCSTMTLDISNYTVHRMLFYHG